MFSFKDMLEGVVPFRKNPTGADDTSNAHHVAQSISSHISDHGIPNHGPTPVPTGPDIPGFRHDVPPVHVRTHVPFKQEHREGVVSALDKKYGEGEDISVFGSKSRAYWHGSGKNRHSVLVKDDHVDVMHTPGPEKD